MLNGDMPMICDVPVCPPYRFADTLSIYTLQLLVGDDRDEGIIVLDASPRFRYNLQRDSEDEII